ncbi:MAG: MCE family protein [Deltaproteobacteria bacterium]|nr:MCE family protein [Deltaproteobacteria bacterium]
MASPRTKFMVGIFVAGGFGIALVAFIWLGMSRFLEKGRYYVVYFNESVQGLTVDSPVKYRGVSIGRVHSIGVAPDAKLIQVILKIESRQNMETGIVAQLKTVGITGSMFVELDRKMIGETDRTPPLSFPSEYPILASKPSDISELFRGVDDVLNKIRSFDLEGISDRIKLTLDSINLAIADLKVNDISRKIDVLLDNVNQTVIDADLKGISKNVNNILSAKRWNSILDGVEEASKSLNDVMERANRVMVLGEKSLQRVDGILSDEEDTIKYAFEDFREAVKNANAFLKRGMALTNTTDESIIQLRRYLIITGQNLEKATGNLNRLIELISDHPPQLLFGEPPPSRKVAPIEKADE